MDSDVDPVLLTSDPALYVGDNAWIADLGALAAVCTREWGALTERRLAMAAGWEIEIGVASPAWASTSQLDPGTRRVALGGLSRYTTR